MRAIILLSGGLDSLLAARLILNQGVELEALNFVTVFCNCTPKSRCSSAAASVVQQLGIKLKVINNTEAFLSVARNPPHGYGSNLNPCIDCRILMFRKAADYMRKTGASFLVTGEEVVAVFLRLKACVKDGRYPLKPLGNGRMCSASDIIAHENANAVNLLPLVLQRQQ